MKKFIAIFLILISILFVKTSYAQNYSKVAGLYQLYQSGEPVNIDQMNMFYILNKNGIVLMAMGKSTGIAFSDISNGIASGRIMTGNFSMQKNKLTMNMKKGTGNTYWTYNANDNSITKGNMSLIYIERL